MDFLTSEAVCNRYQLLETTSEAIIQSQGGNVGVCGWVKLPNSSRGNWNQIGEGGACKGASARLTHPTLNPTKTKCLCREQIFTWVSWVCCAEPEPIWLGPTIWMILTAFQPLGLGCVLGPLSQDRQHITAMKLHCGKPWARSQGFIQSEYVYLGIGFVSM